MSKSKQIALEIKAIADLLGWSICAEANGILTITKWIRPNDNDAFVQADGEYYSILSRMPQSRPGSMWGTDGGGIGALSAIKHGVFKMHKSGCNKNILKALKTIID